MSDIGLSKVKAQKWMQENHEEYESDFDLAVDCAYCLDLCEICEIHGDKTFIPIWLQEMAKEFFDENR